MQGKKEENLIETVSIRAMQKARYSTHNIGHYGLAFDYYTHFTSPIRRYPRPDGAPPAPPATWTSTDAASPSASTRPCASTAAAWSNWPPTAERASVKYKQVEFMQDRLGQTYDGVISGVTEWGLYVELNENKCEGMVPYATWTTTTTSSTRKTTTACVAAAATTPTAWATPVTVRVARANLEKKAAGLRPGGLSMSRAFNHIDTHTQNDEDHRHNRPKGNRVRHTELPLLHGGHHRRRG